MRYRMNKKYVCVFLTVLSLILFTGCETTTGTKRENGSNSERIYAKWKNVTVNGNLTIGGATQNTEGASQEGLGKVTAEAELKDSANGNQVPAGGLQESLKIIPSKQNVPNAK